MISRSAAVVKPAAVASPVPDRACEIRFISVILLSAACGLVAGLLEVATVVVRKQLFDPDHLYKMSRHFVWLIPVSNLCVFLTLGLLASAVILVSPRRGHWLFMRVLCAFTLLPSFLVGFPRIYGLALLVVALGLSVRVVPSIDGNRPGFRRLVLGSILAAGAIVLALAGSILANDRWKQARENARFLPPPGSPNILLIVLDTVAAGHLSLHGYNRSTSATLSELATRGTRFDSARAASSWTLPSHATMFTGRWTHELSVGWFTPLDQKLPTLAEFLGDRGYATAGFVANTYYCGSDTGLARGFTRYQDFIFPELTALKTAALVGRTLEEMRGVAALEDWLESAGLLRIARRLVQSLDADRKAAAVINNELLDWLSARAQPERPFFAFVNYYDAHYPYELPPNRLHRFGFEPADVYQRFLIQQWGVLDKTTVTSEGVQFAAAAYDDCIADLDEQLGKLVDELNRRGNLERTWVIVTADHGESFGEHAGIFCHGMTLYDTELHVPLIIVPPGGSATKQVVKEAVCLRDLAVTIVDLAGQSAGSPFPGESLARMGTQPGMVPVGTASASPSLAEVVPTDPHTGDYWGASRQQLSPLAAVKDKEWSYIRRVGDSREQLFHLSEDANEQRDLAAEPSARTTLERMRAALDHLSGGPLSPERFGR
jgi:arylsulfatase A-like enzyme